MATGRDSIREEDQTGDSACERPYSRRERETIEYMMDNINITKFTA